MECKFHILMLGDDQIMFAGLKPDKWTYHDQDQPNN
jgi:hypothetical protein